MPYIANTDAERADMLAAVGVKRIEDLFGDVPEAYRFPTLNLPVRFPRPATACGLEGDHRLRRPTRRRAPRSRGQTRASNARWVGR